MNKTEAASYFHNKSMRLQLLKNFIDYENIETPIQTIEDDNQRFFFSVEQQSITKIILQSHNFSDNSSKLQLLGGETYSEFLNLDYVDKLQYPSDFNTIESYQKVRIFLGTKQIIHNRRVYDSQEFLEDAGGIYGALIWIGTVIHFLVSGKALPIQMFAHYFKVSSRESFEPKVTESTC